MRLEPRWAKSKPPAQPIELQLIDSTTLLKTVNFPLILRIYSIDIILLLKLCLKLN